MCSSSQQCIKSDNNKKWWETSSTFRSYFCRWCSGLICGFFCTADRNIFYSNTGCRLPAVIRKTRLLLHGNTFLHSCDPMRLIAECECFTEVSETLLGSFFQVSQYPLIAFTFISNILQLQITIKPSFWLQFGLVVTLLGSSTNSTLSWVSRDMIDSSQVYNQTTQCTSERI